jgi:hypothetical protein
MAALTFFVDESTQGLNAIKAILQLIANGVAGVVFAFAGPVAWGPAGALAFGAVIGGQLGARLARRIPSSRLRLVVAVIGIGASGWLIVRQLA